MSVRASPVPGDDDDGDRPARGALWWWAGAVPGETRAPRVGEATPPSGRAVTADEATTTTSRPETATQPNTGSTIENAIVVVA